MRVEERGILAHAAAAAGGPALSLALTSAARAQDNAQDKIQDKTQDKTRVMKITLPTLHDAVHRVALNWAAAVETDSGGRVEPQVYPASRLGSIQALFISPEFMVGVDPRFEVTVAPGLVSSMAAGIPEARQRVGR